MPGHSQFASVRPSPRAPRAFSPRAAAGALRAPGKPLEAEVRGFFEPRFGHDLSRVRVHTDARAAESARALRARAYAAGDHIVFGANQYGRGAEHGLGVLAHELSHVVQQGRGGGAAAGAEAGARAAVERLASGQVVPPEVAGSAAPGLYRDGEEEPFDRTKQSPGDDARISESNLHFSAECW